MGNTGPSFPKACLSRVLSPPRGLHVSMLAPIADLYTLIAQLQEQFGCVLLQPWTVGAWPLCGRFVVTSNARGSLARPKSSTLFQAIVNMEQIGFCRGRETTQAKANVHVFFRKSAKMFHYAGWRRTCDSLFVVFALVFLVTRLLVLPTR